MNPVTEDPPQTRPLRADAVRNQRRILTAARELFGSLGLDITLDLVAEHAGVGVGTVYRRFANKHELITAVFEDGVQSLADRAAMALDHADPWTGLVEFFAYACEDFATNRGLSEVVRMEDGKALRMICVREQLEPAVRRVIQRAGDAGVLRPEIEISDFFALIHMLDAVAVFSRPVNPDVWRRYFDIMLDGLRADSLPRRPITTPAMTTEQIEDAKLVACGEKKRV